MSAQAQALQTQHQPADPAFPPGWRIIPDQALRRRQDGRLLMGGSPFRFLRLSTAGARMVDRWFSGEELDQGRAAQRLAKRLVASGMAHPSPSVPTAAGVHSSAVSTSVLSQTATASAKANRSTTADLTIVIPVKDDIEGLLQTLDGLAGLPVIVIDDGSVDPLVISELLRTKDETEPRHLVTLIRNKSSQGPGAARNQGISALSSEFIVLVDAGVKIDRADVEQLASHFADPGVVAVAPRVRSVIADQEGPSMLELYESEHSPLDLGPAPARVQPGSSVAYVPTACLAIRSEALSPGRLSSDIPFDPGLRYGEDVDLEWRLNEIGTIRYDPGVVVTHPPRPSIPTFVRQRVGYGSAAAPLATRHGSMVAPYRTSPWSLSVILAVLLRWFGGAGLLAGISSFVMWRKLGDNVPDREIESVRLTTTGHYWGAVALGETSLRAWWPLTIVSLLLPWTRTPTAIVATWGLASRVWKHRTHSDPKTQAAQTALGILDDLSYGYGVWQGAWDEGSLRAIAPDIPGLTDRG